MTYIQLWALLTAGGVLYHGMRYVLGLEVNWGNLFAGVYWAGAALLFASMLGGSGQ